LAVPLDLSVCDRCRRPAPPSTDPGFADWEVVKDEDGKVSGMRCPACQTAPETDDPTIGA